MGKPIGYATRLYRNLGVSDSVRPRVYTLRLVAPSKIVSEAKKRLEKAGIQVGPGVDLRLK